ncbi:hypothetical protein B0H67DRAFT_593339 [Lasiosphaeris hirsuta]|uniref:AT hook domain-containing protein n=1 Tax=Lasiosphaeris hirsuta TaxID=260670 RepID=A0AA39ZX13_9PEZI|nr:hypothetical protein B0H67DRAFT_593339 [Lasiosphaeris hirsuta]
MAVRKEILDSEDEGSDFSPVKGAIEDELNLVEHDTPLEPEVEPRGKPLDTANAHHSSLLSTDPSFFQRVYDEQQAVSSAHYDVSYPTAVADPTSLSEPINAAAVHGKQQKPKNSSSLTSITDPTPPSRKQKYAKTYESHRKSEVIDLTLTQVTTPSREGAGNATSGARIKEAATGMWDVPSSSPPMGNGGSAAGKEQSKVARTYGKRKRAGLLQQQQQDSSPRGASDDIPPTQDPYDFPSTADPSLPPMKKKAKRGLPSSLARQSLDSSPGVVPHTGEEMGPRASRKGRRNVSSGYDSVIPDTGAGLYIAPSALTASQRQQYRMVSPSSEPGHDTPEPSLPLIRTDEGGAHRSSCPTTVAYTTPSRYASSSRRALPSDELPGTAPVEDSLEQAAMHPTSSPDVISVESTRARRKGAQPGSSDVIASSPAKPSLGARSTKKRKTTQRQSEGICAPGEDSFDMDLLGWPQEQGNKHSDRRNPKHAPPPPPPPTRIQGPYKLPLSDGETPPPNDSRNMSTLISDIVSVPVDEPPVEIPSPVVQDPTPPKKRGRRKKEAKIVETIIEEEIAEQSTHVPTESPKLANEPVEAYEPEPVKKKRGRPRKSEVSKVVALIDLDDVPEPKPAVEPNPGKSNSRDEEEVAVDAPVETPASPIPKAKLGKRGRKKKVVEKVIADTEDEDEDEDEGTPKSARALSDLHTNVQPPATSATSNETRDDGAGHGKDKDAKEDDQGVKSVSQVKETAKPRVTTADQATTGKVQYRVGLSKKSRIAPLLKSLRK